MTTIESKKWLTIGDVAELCQVSQSTVWRWKREGLIQTFKVGGSVRILPKELSRLEKELPKGDTSG
jgi:excisionase family DNA binding protein